MRYKDFAPRTIKEARLTHSPGKSGYGTMTAMSSKTLDMVRNIQQWEREKAEVKAAKAKEKVTTKHASEQSIELGAKSIPLKLVYPWIENHDKQEAFNNFSRFDMVKVPEEIRNEIKADPEWQASVLRILELSEAILKSRELPKSNMPRTAKGSWQLERMGYDPHDGYKAIELYKNAVQKILNKHGIDKHGLRLPPG